MDQLDLESCSFRCARSSLLSFALELDLLWLWRSGTDEPEEIDFYHMTQLQRSLSSPFNLTHQKASLSAVLIIDAILRVIEKLMNSKRYDYVLSNY